MRGLTVGLACRNGPGVDTRRNWKPRKNTTTAYREESMEGVPRAPLCATLHVVAERTDTGDLMTYTP